MRLCLIISAGIAQSVEHFTRNEGVVRSSRITSSRKKDLSKQVFFHRYKYFGTKNTMPNDIVCFLYVYYTILFFLFSIIPSTNVTTHAITSNASITMNNQPSEPTFKYGDVIKPHKPKRPVTPAKIDA